MSTATAGVKVSTNLCFEDANDVDDPVVVSYRAIPDNHGCIAVLIDDARLQQTEHCARGRQLYTLTGRWDSMPSFEVEVYKRLQDLATFH